MPGFISAMNYFPAEYLAAAGCVTVGCGACGGVASGVAPFPE